MSFFFFIRWRKEGEDGDGGGGWRNTSVFAMILLQNIIFHDKIPLLGKIGRAHVLTWFARLISDRVKSILRLVLWDLFLVVEEVELGVVWAVVTVDLILSSFSCLAVFTPDWILSLLSWETLFLRRVREGSIGVPWDATDEAFFLRGFWALAKDGGSVMWCHHCLVRPREAHLASLEARSGRRGDFSSGRFLIFVQESPWAFFGICGRWREQ